MYLFACLLILKFDLRLRMLFFILSDFSVQGTAESQGGKNRNLGEPTNPQRSPQNLELLATSKGSFASQIKKGEPEDGNCGS